MKEVVFTGKDGKIEKVVLLYRKSVAVARKPSGYASFKKSVYDKPCGHDWCFKELKKGGYRLFTEERFLTPLQTCGKCGKLMKPDYRNNRYFKCNNVYSKKDRQEIINKDTSNIYFWEKKYLCLCSGCYKKVKRVADMAAMYFEIKKLINKINREIGNERKKNNNNRQP